MTDRDASDISYTGSRTGTNPQKGCADNTDKRNHHHMISVTDYLLKTALTLSTGILSTATKLHK
jgi:hypothetical protein